MDFFDNVVEDVPLPVPLLIPHSQIMVIDLHNPYPWLFRFRLFLLRWIKAFNGHRWLIGSVFLFVVLMEGLLLLGLNKHLPFLTYLYSFLFHLAIFGFFFRFTKRSMRFRLERSLSGSGDGFFLLALFSFPLLKLENHVWYFGQVFDGFPCFLGIAFPPD